MNRKNVRILLVDDDITLTSLIKDLLETKGYAVDLANSYEEAEERLNLYRYRVVVSDFVMPGKTGLDLLKFCTQTSRDMQFIMVTAFGSIENAVEALKMGAFDYLTKPIQIDELLIIIEKALDHGELTARNRFLTQELDKMDEYCFESRSDNYLSLLKSVEQVKEVCSTVLLQGETGTGKEVLAKLIHSGGPCRNGNFVPINCGALPESLLESELFGYEKGAFTDAVKDQTGKLEFADEGTLFLDEVEAMSPKAQISLLRFLQEGEITRLGSNKRIRLNVRIIAATNKDLIEMCREGSFREDLYYRISVFPMEIPPLRERKDDILVLADWLLECMGRKLSRRIAGFSSEAQKALLSYPWPGNIRELRNCIERAVIVERSGTVQKDSLFLRPIKTLPMKFDEIGLIPLKTLEESYISWALGEMEGNKTATAEALGISPRGLYYKLDR